MSLKSWKNMKENPIYITDEEREKCRRIAEAFTEIYEQEDMLVVEAGKYGFLKLQYYQIGFGFEDVKVYTDSQALFKSLWKDWLYTQLLDWAGDTPISEMEYQDIFKCMPIEIQKELIRKKYYLKKKLGLIEGRKTLWKNGAGIGNILIGSLYVKTLKKWKRRYGKGRKSILI